MSGPGHRIIEANVGATVVFGVVATAATVAPDALIPAAVAVSLVLFAAGIVAFLWGYGLAVERSRTDLIGVGGLFFLAGSAPRSVRLRMMGATAAQAAVALTAASIRPFTGLAFCVLVPVLGLRLSGLWAARHGTFPPRQ